MVSLREEFDSLSITKRNSNRKNSQLTPYSLKDQFSDDQIPIFQRNKVILNIILLKKASY